MTLEREPAPAQGAPAREDTKPIEDAPKYIRLAETAGRVTDLGAVEDAPEDAKPQQGEVTHWLEPLVPGRVYRVRGEGD